MNFTVEEIQSFKINANISDSGDKISGSFTSKSIPQMKKASDTVDRHERI